MTNMFTSVTLVFASRGSQGQLDKPQIAVLAMSILRTTKLSASSYQRAVELQRPLRWQQHRRVSSDSARQTQGDKQSAASTELSPNLPPQALRRASSSRFIPAECSVLMPVCHGEMQRCAREPRLPAEAPRPPRWSRLGVAQGIQQGVVARVALAGGSVEHLANDLLGGRADARV